VAPKGPASLKVLENALADETCELPGPVREMGAIYLEQIARLTEVIARLADELEAASKTDAQLRRLCTIPGIGPVTAGAVAAFAPCSRGTVPRGLLKRLAQAIGRSALEVSVSRMARTIKRAAVASFLRFIAAAVSRAWIFMFSMPRRMALSRPWSVWRFRARPRRAIGGGCKCRVRPCPIGAFSAWRAVWRGSGW